MARRRGTFCLLRLRYGKKKQEPPKPTPWSIHKIAAKQVWVGSVEAIDADAAIEAAAKEFNVDARRLIAFPRR